jgi:hypothetical protein
LAFELVGVTLSETIDERDELLFDVARILQPSLPLVRRLEADFYDSPTFSAAEAMMLAEELTLLATSLLAAPEAAQQAWAARPPAFRSLVMPHPPDAAAIAAKVTALAHTCRDTGVHGGMLKGLSD